MVKVAVLGAGINGLTAAVRIKEKYRCFDVVLISNEFSPNTTADGSGGLWHPYLCGNTPQTLLTRWGGETYKFLHQLWRQEGCNISMMTMHSLRTKHEEHATPAWAQDVFEYKELGPKDLQDLGQIYGIQPEYGYSFMSFVVHSTSMLTYLQRRFLQDGGSLKTATIKSLDDTILDVYDVIVNCTGLAARTIVPDSRVFPIRGQIHKVKAPWLSVCVMVDDLYIIPNAINCVLGGTHQVDSYNTNIDQNDMARIMKGCQQLIPALKNAEIIENWVGLRPGRDVVRLEPEIRHGKLYIHNYGHGGSGLTLFWGCGSDVLRIFDEHIDAVHGKNKGKQNKTAKV